MIYEDYMASKDPNYQKLSLRKVIKKFQTDSKGLLQMRRGKAYSREKKKTERMVKQEQKLELKPEKVRIPGQYRGNNTHPWIR